MNKELDEAVESMSIEEAMEEAVTSYLPFAHKLYKEIHELNKKLTDQMVKNVTKGQLWVENDY